MTSLRKFQQQSNLGKKGAACLIASFALFQTGCGSTKSAATSAAVSTASISGIVSSLSNLVSVGTSTTSSRVIFTGDVERGRFSEKATSDTCASGTFSAVYVGGGGGVVATGSVTSNAFKMPAIQVGKELAVTFTCGTTSYRCFAKAGDTGISCNPVADAIIGAFETAIGKPITNAAYSGKVVAKVASSIVQAAQNSSTATDAFNTQVTTCQALTGTAKSTCMVSAIASSPFQGAFKMMQASINGWTIDSIFTLVADVMGETIGIDTFIYTGFGTLMDTALSTDFVASTRAYIAALVADQLAGGNTYVVQAQCQMGYNKFQSGGQINYSPIMATISGVSQPSCAETSQFTALGYTAPQVALIQAGLTSGQSIDLSGSAVGCQSFNNPAQNCVYPPRLVINAKNIEKNRNDPSNANGGDFFRTQQESLINTYSELNTAMTTAMAAPGYPAGCMSGGNNGPPVIAQNAACLAWFKSFISANKTSFSGLMGLYLYMKNPANYANTTLSLNQLHKIFTLQSSNYLSSVLTMQGFNACGANITGGSGGNNYLPPLMSITNGMAVQGAGFGCNGNSMNTISSTAAATQLAAAVPPIDADFAQFESIPTAAQVNQYVYGSGYHTDFNPSGNKLFWTAAVQSSGIPIFCKMTDTVTGTATERPLDPKVKITCLSTTTGLTAPDSTTGAMTLPAGYPYTLQNYGGGGGGTQGSVMALSDAKSGARILAGGQPILVYQINAGNGVGACDGSTASAVFNGATQNSTDGSVNMIALNFGFGTGAMSQVVPAYCMDMTNFALTSSFSLFYGGNLSVNTVDSNGNKYTNYIPLLGGMVTGSINPQPVCYFAPSHNLTIDTATGFASTGTTGAAATINGSGVITATGTAVVDFCSNSSTYPSSTQYDLVMGQNGQSGTRTNLTANLLPVGTTGTSSGNLAWENWTSNPWASQVSIGITQIEAAAAGGLTAFKVAPSAQFAPLQNVQLANSKWQKKFDPYCDDRNGNGYCDCTDHVTGAAKDPTTCSLVDDASEPTLSQAPFNTMDPHFTAVQALFTACGGKVGAALDTCISGGATTMNQTYFNTAGIFMDFNSVFQCAYLASGETTYRFPNQLNWSDFGSLFQGGCPASAGGTIVALSGFGMNGPTAGGGPVRMVNPVQASNAYLINRPNTTIKLINYATKTVGQGVSLLPATSAFAFDEALALVNLRYMMPVTGIKAYVNGTTKASAAAQIPGAELFFQSVSFGNNNGSATPVGAVLRGMTHQSEVK